jgi:SagB-type dehydrogenase family enzyme
LILSAPILFSWVFESKHSCASENQDIVKLPQPKYTSKISVEEALQSRRSVRKYSTEPLTLPEVSQLLWAAQGITRSRGFKTAPSAGALFPLEVYLVAGNVKGIKAGLYKYNPEGNELIKIASGDKRIDLYRAALQQPWVKDGAIAILLAGVFQRTQQKYGARGSRYVHIESGSAAQNVYLQAASLKLGTVLVGAFDDKKVKSILQMSPDEDPLVIMPVGRVKS